MAKKGKSAPKSTTPKKIKVPKSKSNGTSDIPFGLDRIEEYNAAQEEVEPTNLEEAVSDNDEEALGLGLSDEEDYDWDGEGDEDIPEYDFDEDEYERKERKGQMDDEDKEILGAPVDDIDKPFSIRMKGQDAYRQHYEKDDDIEEAKRQQKELRAEQALEDFDFDPAPVVKKAQKSKEEKMLESFNDDLAKIDLKKTEVETLKKKVSAKDKEANIKEKIERLKQESPELLTLLKDFKEKLHEAHNVIQPILERAKNNEIPTSEGISFLEVKNQLLLSYCININFYLMLKARGEQVKDHPVVDQLVRIRAIMDKAKPIEKKLSYQIDKLVRTANLGAAAGGNEELTSRPNPDDLEVDEEDEEVDDLGLYRAPKFSGDDDALETTSTMDKKKIQREQKRMKDTAMARFMEEEYGEKPMESTPGLASEDFELRPHEKALEELEEANFRRKDLTKADKRKYQKRLEGINDVLSGRADFGDVSVFDDDYEKKKDQEFLAQKRMRAHMDDIDNRKRALKNKTDGDEELSVAPKRVKTQQQGVMGRGMMFDEEIESEEEMDERRPHFEAGGVPRMDEELQEGTKRKAAKNIEENRGMRRIRNKDIKTPRTRQKIRFQKRMSKMGGGHKIKPASRDGLQSRISTNTVRGKKYAN